MKLFYTIFFILVLSFNYTLFAEDARGVIDSVVSAIAEDQVNPEDAELSKSERNAAKQRFLRDMALVYDHVFQNYYKAPDPNKMLNGALAGLMQNLGDPYSTFITPEEASLYSEDIAGEFGGVGIRIDVGTDEESGISYIKVITPLSNTPGERLGIQAGDLIISVDGTSLAGKNTNDAVKIIRGKPGTTVNLTMKRGRKIFSLDIVREVINNIDLSYSFIDDDTAYVKINSFSQDLMRDFTNAITEIDKKGYETILIDLRNNPGGSLQAVIDLSDAFLEEGFIVGTEARDPKENQMFNSTDDLLVPSDKKVIVMVNKGSASASEIFSGAIKYRGRGTVVGTTTYGKGLVQSVNGFEAGFISMTISQYYTPGRHFINEKGITPDIEISSDIEEDLTPKQLNDLRIFRQDEIALKYVEKNLQQSKEELLRGLKREIAKRGLVISDIFLKQSLHYAQNRQKNKIEVFNLDVDTVLRKTVEMLRDGSL